LLRRVALGLPLTSGVPIAALAGALGCGPRSAPCPPPVGTVLHAIDATTRARIFADAASYASQQACEDVCRGYDVIAANDAGVDGGDVDAGWGALYYTTVRCDLVTPDGGGAELLACTYTPTCIGGRAPVGLLASSARGHGVGAWLARAAYLEQASVEAFDDLAGALARFEAPEDLVRDARAAAHDERKHAGLVARLAAAQGAEVDPVRRTPSAWDGIEALALDNAVEGCTREDYAALVAARQARVAEDPEVRATYATIAADEARHALLSHRIDAWARGRLTLVQRRGIGARRRAAVASFRTAPVEPSEVRAFLGLPSSAERDVLFDALA
jgi:hypothetical protein